MKKNNSNQLEIKIVENEDEKLKAFLVRGIVYIEEQDCPYEEEFDLNDFSSTLIVGVIGSEPVLTARIRYFDNFAKLERVAIRKKYRQRGYAHRLIKFMIDCCRRKGYSKLYMHAQIRLKNFYEEYNFHQIGEEFSFSDYEYIEMVCLFKNAYNPEMYMTEQPLLLDRSDGHPYEKNELEKSADRADNRYIAV